MSGARILVVDDEPAISRAVRVNLVRHGYEATIADSGAGALAAFRAQRPDCVLLDLGLPDMDGCDVIQTIRETSATPIIVLSARGGERDKVIALDAGADDYLTKPFGVDELLARVRVALRHAARTTSGASAVFRSGGLEVDLEARRVLVDGHDVHLTPTEYDLLKAFVANPGKILTDRMLLRHVWGSSYGADEHYLHVYIARLRKKIEADPRHPRRILNDPGIGYRLIVDDR